MISQEKSNCRLIMLMGRYGQKKKVTEISPPASILACGPGNNISVKIDILSQKWAF